MRSRRARTPGKPDPPKDQDSGKGSDPEKLRDSAKRNDSPKRHDPVKKRDLHKNQDKVTELVKGIETIIVKKESVPKIPKTISKYEDCLPSGRTMATDPPSKKTSHSTKTSNTTKRSEALPALTGWTCISDSPDKHSMTCASRRSSRSGSRKFLMSNKACNIAPDQVDFTQRTSSILGCDPDTDQYKSLLLEQYGFEPSTKLRRLRKNPCEMLSPKVDNGSQYVDPEGRTCLISSSPWLYADSPDEIDDLLKKQKQFTLYSSKDIRISETPRVKVIAEEFTRYKKNNIELRKLEERIVCVEYDVFDRGITGLLNKPVQTMRAYFSIKTSCAKCEGGSKLLSEIPDEIKDAVQIDEEQIKKYCEREIEMIDGKIADNKPYLDDLARVLKKKQALNMKKNKTTLDLVSMYDMAKREGPTFDHDFSNTNLLSKAELQEMKDLILKQCESTAHGICRKTVKPSSEIPVNEVSKNTDSVFYAMLRGN